MKGKRKDGRNAYMRSRYPLKSNEPVDVPKIFSDIVCRMLAEKATEPTNYLASTFIYRPIYGKERELTKSAFKACLRLRLTMDWT